jgi:DNA-binding transcriptional ArsR family regulator
MTHDGESQTRDTVVLDAKGLRALAHPVRVQALTLLRRHGPLTATQIAERLGVNSGTASYHLRQLAAAGFVEDDAERGNARERWWRAVHRKTSIEDSALAGQEPEATLAYLQSVAGSYALHTQRTIDSLQTLPAAWQDAFDLSNWPLRLTPAEADSLRTELRAVIARYREDSAEAAASAPDGAERITLITQLLPEPGDAS